MFDDVKELIDQAAPPPDHAHRDQLWQQFQDVSSSPKVRPTTVLRPPAPQPVAKPSDTIILEKITVADELATRRNRRRRYGLLAAAAAVLSVAGFAAANRSGKTLQVAPAAEPSSTISTGSATSTSPSAPPLTAAPTTTAPISTTSPATTSAATAPPKTVPATSVAPVATAAATTTVAKPSSTVGIPSTKPVTIIVPSGGNEPVPGLMNAVAKWDGKNFVKLNAKAAPGPYQDLDGDKFDIDAEGHLVPPAGSSSDFYPGISFGATPRVMSKRSRIPGSTSIGRKQAGSPKSLAPPT
jgi:hypothetical protein